MNDNILEIRDLEIQYVTEEGIVRAVNNVDLEVRRGSAVGLVGETGAGKTTTCLGILNLISQITMVFGMKLKVNIIICEPQWSTKNMH